MVMRKIAYTMIFAVYFIIVGFLGNGCSSGGDNPLTPAGLDGPNNSKNHFQKVDSSPIAFVDTLPDGGMTGVGVFGLYDVFIDKSNLSGDLTSIRSAFALKDSFVVDITNFLSITPCSDCLKLTSLSMSSNSNLIATFSITHPFQPGNLSNPPSAQNRLDLHIFDVFGILYFPGKDIEYSLIDKSTSPVKLVNADGYTDKFNSRIDSLFSFDASLHPYRVMGRNNVLSNYDPSTPSGFMNIMLPIGHNVIPMGSGPVYTDYEIDFGEIETLSMLMVITAAYGQSAVRDTRLYPVYYLPEFNRKEAWKVDVTILENNLYQPLDTSYCDLRIEVYDWNHTSTIDPDMTLKDSIKASSSVESVQIIIPDVTDAPVTATGPAYGNGRTTPLGYNARVYNVAGGPFGLKQGLIKVTDSRVPGININGIGDGVDRDGVNFFDLDEFATYQIFEIEVESPAPRAVINTYPNPPFVNPNDPVYLDGSASYDFDGIITLYEWDFDYDGVVFNAQSNEAIPSTPVAYDNNHNFDNREITVALRVTDDNNSVPFTNVASKIITIMPNRSPIADFTMSTYDPICSGDIVDFDATLSYDPDDDNITSYEWDFDYQGGSFNVHSTDAITSHEFTRFGKITIALRVADEGQPTPRQSMKTEQILIIPKFDPSERLSGSFTNVQFPHSLNSSVIVTDPNSNDVYLAYAGTGTLSGLCPPHSTGSRIRIHRSTDGGYTWSAPTFNNCSPNAQGLRGFALCVVPGSPHGKLWVFWVAAGNNQSSVQQDGYNIRFNYGTPDGSGGIEWGNLSWLDDITMWSLSNNPSTRYFDRYYQYSEPTDLSVVADPVASGTVYLSFVEQSTHASIGKSIRLVRTNNIDSYPNSVWTPMTKTEHVDSTTTSLNFDSTDMVLDNSRNLYIVYDDDSRGRIAMRKYPYGQAPGDPIIVVNSHSSHTALSRPRIAIDNQNNPTIVYYHTHHSGGVDGVADIVMNRYYTALHQMGPTILVSDSDARGSIQQEPDIAIHKNSGMVFVTWEDRRDYPSYREIYWTAFDNNLQKLIPDERVNTVGVGNIEDYNVYMTISDGSAGPNLIATWYQHSNSIYTGHAQ